MAVENYRTKEAHDPDERYGVDASPEENHDHPLDSEECCDLHSKLWDWFKQSQEAHSENRQEQAIDQSFADGDQWTPDDAEILRERGQAPLVFNLIKPAVDWISGTEKRTRIGFNVMPRSDEHEHTEAALNKLKLLKYVSDVNKASFARSKAFKDAVTVGVGWLEIGIRNDDSDEPIFIRREAWQNIFYDHLASQEDLSDARYIFRTRWVDLDIAKAMFPERAKALELGADKSTRQQFSDDDLWVGQAYANQRESLTGGPIERSWYTTNPQGASQNRERVRLIECWYRTPQAIKVLSGKPSHAMHGVEFNPQDMAQQQLIEEGILSVYDAVKMKMNVCIMTDRHILQKMSSPYRHNEFPFTPIWGYRKGRDNMAYGVVRNSRDPQEDLNKRRSKALHILSTKQVIADKNSVDDWNEAIDEIARPDGVIKVNGDRRFEIVQDRQLAQQHIELMVQDREFINNTSGVTGENLGLDTNATSGRAILAKQQEGSAITYEVFDNLRMAIQLNGEKCLSLIEQFYDEEKIIRLSGDEGAVEFTKVNIEEFDALTGNYVMRNDITRTRSDFIVDTQDFRQTVRQAMFEQMLDVMKTMPPEISVNILDLLVEMSDLPNKVDLVERIRKITGQTPPGEEPSEEQIAAQQAEQVSAELERELSQRDLLAKITEREARAEKIRMESQGAALDMAPKAAVAPDMAPAADSLLASAGFKGQF